MKINDFTTLLSQYTGFKQWFPIYTKHSKSYKSTSLKVQHPPLDK